MATFDNTSTTTSVTDNLSPQARAALEQLLASLTGGTNAGVNRQVATQTDAINRTKAASNDYSKSAAFADSQGAVNAASRKALEELLPQLTRSAEGSGTSQSSLRALLTQKAAQDAADSAATLGINAAASYGNINTNLLGILAQLSAQGDPANKALLDALNVAKGATSTTTQTSQTPVGINLPRTNFVSGNSGSSGGSSAPNYDLSGSFGITDNQAQSASIDRQLGLISGNTF